MHRSERQRLALRIKSGQVRRFNPPACPSEQARFCGTPCALARVGEAASVTLRDSGSSADLSAIRGQIKAITSVNPCPEKAIEAHVPAPARPTYGSTTPRRFVPNST